jgi:hypothetical protein
LERQRRCPARLGERCRIAELRAWAMAELSSFRWRQTIDAMSSLKSASARFHRSSHY